MSASSTQIPTSDGCTPTNFEYRSIIGRTFLTSVAMFSSVIVSRSETTAASIKRYLLSLGPRSWIGKRTLSLAALFWTRLNRPQRARLAGSLLFTKDDDLINPDQRETAVPRDNVVFEAGYFIGLKGKRNVLIIRESGSKMPADLGGDIYAALGDKANIVPIERTLAAFMDAI